MNGESNKKMKEKRKMNSPTCELRLPKLFSRRRDTEADSAFSWAKEDDGSATPASGGESSMAIWRAGTLMQRLVASARLARLHASPIAPSPSDPQSN